MRSPGLALTLRSLTRAGTRSGAAAARASPHSLFRSRPRCAGPVGAFPGACGAVAGRLSFAAARRVRLGAFAASSGSFSSANLLLILYWHRSLSACPTCPSPFSSRSAGCQTSRPACFCAPSLLLLEFGATGMPGAGAERGAKCSRDGALLREARVRYSNEQASLNANRGSRGYSAPGSP